MRRDMVLRAVSVILGVTGALLVIAGPFLPWINVIEYSHCDFLEDSRTCTGPVVTGSPNGFDVEKFWVPGFSCGILVLGALGLGFTLLRRKLAMLVALFLGVLVALLAATASTSILARTRPMPGAFSLHDTTSGVGPALIVVGGAALAVGSSFALTQLVRARKAAASSVVPPETPPLP